MDAGRETRPPWGAVAVVLVGLVATLAAALLSTEEPIGATSLSWEAMAPLPDSRPAAIPGGGTMRLSEAGMRATERNDSGYRLYRISALLTIVPRPPAGGARLRCSVRVPRDALVAHTTNNRAAYPQPTEGVDLLKQAVPPESIVKFSSHGTELARVELRDAFGAFADEPGIVVDWGPFQYGEGLQVWDWKLPGSGPAKPLRLAFATIWRTPTRPAARIICTLRTPSGRATVRTAGTLGQGRAGS